MANLSNIITPTNVLTETSTNTVTNKTLTDPKIVLGGTNGTVGQALLSQGAGVAPAWTTLGAAGGQYSAIASGAIASAGLVVKLNSDGTVSVVAGNNASTSTPVAFNAVFSTVASSAYDPVNKKVVIGYRDGTNSNGVAVVGTVSGTTITYGTPVVFSTIGNDINVVFDSTNNKFVVFYRATSNFGYGKVGTVSGSSISFGSEFTFYAGITAPISAAYDPVNSKILVTYLDQTVGPALRSLVATVSGTSLSFGTVVNHPLSTASSSFSTTYNPASANFVLAIQRTNDLSRGWANAVTISGTTPTFGSAYRFDTLSASHIASTYDSVNQKVVIVYSRNGATADAICANVSGTVITYGERTTFSSSSVDFISTAYDVNVNKVMVAYNDVTNTNSAANTLSISGSTITGSSSALVFKSATNSGTSSIYLAEAQRAAIFYNGSSNFGSSVLYTPEVTNKATRVGIAQNSAANGAAVTVKVQGGVDENQSGLTIGSVYYVSSTGALTTTSTSNPIIGFALKANTLLITNSV